MDDKYVADVQRIMGTTKLSLPLVFIRGKLVGGAQKIIELFEDGELEELVAGLPPVDCGACHLCGGLRFVVCEACNGSHKIYVDKYGFQICSTCNVNGLIRCPSCFPLRRLRMSYSYALP
uniref:Uncharacterized protein n=1 Tax=Rhizophora mucronata TaxID=61149 RepID=A0A2P2QWH2_RHIMU